MLKKINLKKFVFRILVVNVIYFTVKLTIDHNDEVEGFFNPMNLFYYCSAFFLIIFTWELNDCLIRRQLKKKRGLDIPGSIKVLTYTFLIFTPLAAMVYYLAIFEFNHICQIDSQDPGLRFRIDFFRALLLGAAIIGFNIFYHSAQQKKELVQKMNKLEKEAMVSKYKSLRNQISPHFLFNSLNTLTSVSYTHLTLPTILLV